VPECSHCSGTGICPECDGAGKSPLGRPRKGNVFVYGLITAAGLVAVVGLIQIVHNRIVSAIAIVVWFAFCYVVFYRDSQRKKASPRSRF
jgi:hypothetical protein